MCVINHEKCSARQTRLQAGVGVGVETGRAAGPEPVHERLGEHAHVVEREVEPLRAGGRHDVGCVAGEEEPSVAHRLADIAPHAGDTLLEDRSFRERPPLQAEADLQLVPNAIVRPLRRSSSGRD